MPRPESNGGRGLGTARDRFRTRQGITPWCRKKLIHAVTISASMPGDICFNRFWSAILLKNSTPRRCDNRVKKVCREYYVISPGAHFRGVPIQIPAPMLVGIDEENKRLLVPFRKPCYGLSLYVIESDSREIEEIRKELAGMEPHIPVATRPSK